MVVIRRRPAPATPVLATSTHLGVRMMRRVEIKGSPREPHWYVECTTDHDALHRIASAKGLKLRGDQLHIVERYKS